MPPLAKHVVSQSAVGQEHAKCGVMGAVRQEAHVALGISTIKSADSRTVQDSESAGTQRGGRHPGPAVWGSAFGQAPWALHVHTES